MPLDHPLYRTMGLDQILELDGKSGRARMRYIARADQCHSGSIVQGGFITGWIDAAMAHAALAATDFKFTPLSLELKISFFRSATIGPVIAEAWIEQRGRTTMFMEGRLLDEAGQVLAKGTSTVRLVPRSAETR